MDIKYRPIAELERAMWTDNPRKISPTELNKLRTSIREFGFVLPVILNKATGRIVGGHQRVKAAILEGLKSLPTIEIDIESSTELLLNLSLNKISGDWDYAKLAEILGDLAMTPEIELSGFDDSDLLAIFGTDESRKQLIDEIASTSDNTMETFIQESNRSTGLAYVDFRSPAVIFRCDNSEYLDYVDRLKTRVGLSDANCKAEFLKTIGLIA